MHMHPPCVQVHVHSAVSARSTLNGETTESRVRSVYYTTELKVHSEFLTSESRVHHKCYEL